MQLAKELINKPIITIKEGRELGKVQDFFLNHELTKVEAIDLGSEGLLNRKENLVELDDVVTLGEDVIVVKDGDCLIETDDNSQIERYTRRADLNGRPVDTPGGTKIGMIGDVIIDEDALIAGFSLAQIYVSGPIAANRAISRSSVVDTGQEDGSMTVNLSHAEKDNLQVSYEGLFAEPTVAEDSQ